MPIRKRSSGRGSAERAHRYAPQCRRGQRRGAAAASFAYTVVIPLALLLASGIGLASDPAPTDQLAGGCLQGSGAPRQSQVESYPATTFTPVEDGPEKLALDSVIAAPYRTGVVVTQEQLRHYSWRWWRSGPHPFLDSLLPGTQFYRVREHGTAVDDPGRDDNVALYRGKLYHLTQLNALLADAGFILDSAQAPAAAKAAVLFTLMGSEQKTGVIGVLPDFGVSRLAIPAVEFYSVRLDSWPHPRQGNMRYGVAVDCRIAGVSRRLYVENWTPGPRSEPFLLYPGDSLPGPRARFDYVPPPAPANDSRRGCLPADNPERSLQGHFGDIILNSAQDETGT